MGKAIILPECDFSAKNLGKVTFIRPIPLISLEIVGESEYTEHFQLGIVYNPPSTTQKGVTWSIESGQEYAAIDDTGFVTITSGSDHKTIVVRATATQRQDVYAEKSIFVTNLDYQINKSQNNAGVAYDKNGFMVTKFIPVNGAGTIFWSYGRSQSSDFSICVFDKDKKTLDYWGGSDSGGSRTITNSKNSTAYIRAPFWMYLGGSITYNGEEICNLPPVSSE